MDGGYAMACGTGIEGCDRANEWGEAIEEECNSDPRMQWRQLIIKTDKDGNEVWHRQDSYHGSSDDEVPTGTGKVVDSASEYIFLAQDGSLVSVTDEAAGIGFSIIDETGPACKTDLKSDVVGWKSGSGYAQKSSISSLASSRRTSK